MRKPNIGFWIMAIGACFLCNPPVGTVDVLPDLIGYLLLYVGIAELADLNDDLAQAQRAFRNMLWLGLGELFAMLLTEVFLKNTTLELNRYERPVWILLFTFVFLVFEWYFLLPAWKRFFKGFSALAEFHGGTRILSERRGKTACERMAKCTTLFVLAKPLLTLIPELFVLTSFEKDAENPMFTFDWYTYVDTFRILAATASAVIGIVWIIRLLRFFFLCGSDRAWLEQIKAKYEAEILPNKGLMLRRRMGTSFMFFRVASVFLINLTLLYHEFLPDWFSVLLFLSGCLVLGKLFGSIRVHAIISALLLGVGVGRMLLDFAYLEKYIPMDALYQPSAYRHYLPVQILGVAEVALSLALAVLMVSSLIRMAVRYTEVVYEGDEALSARATSRMHAAIRKKARISIILFAASGAAKVAEILILHQSFAWFWLLQFAVSVSAAVVFGNLLTAVSEQILEKYPTDRTA